MTDARRLAHGPRDAALQQPLGSLEILRVRRRATSVMGWLIVLGSLALLAAALRVSWPRVRDGLIRAERAPTVLREFAAGTLVQGGAGRTIVYLALLPWVRVRLPRWLIAKIGRLIAAQQGGSLSELERPIESYGTLDELFTRGINPALRPICGEPGVVVSPVDAEVMEVGTVQAGTLIQAKGMPYQLADLLPISEAERFSGGDYLVLYLRVGDCHRVFCPSDGARVRTSVTIPGRSMPVAPAIATTVPNLYTHNKRFAHLLDTPDGAVALVMVGAFLVGDMDCTYDAEARLSRRGGGKRRDYPAPGPALARGEWMATFHLGSTVVLLLEPGRFVAAAGLRGRKVRYGEKIGSWVARLGSEQPLTTTRNEREST